jgi:hypothetical protein
LYDEHCGHDIVRLISGFQAGRVRVRSLARIPVHVNNPMALDSVTQRVCGVLGLLIAPEGDADLGPVEEAGE